MAELKQVGFVSLLKRARYRELPVAKEWQFTHVAQVSNLLYRRFPIGRSRTCKSSFKRGARPAGWKPCDTAGWKPALQTMKRELETCVPALPVRKPWHTLRACPNLRTLDWSEFITSFEPTV